MENFPNQLKNRFDFVTAGDLINLQNYDENIFEQMLFALKNQGHIIFTA
jgi:hypothetical protein